MSGKECPNQEPDDRVVRCVSRQKDGSMQVKEQRSNKEGHIACRLPETAFNWVWSRVQWRSCLSRQVLRLLYDFMSSQVHRGQQLACKQSIMTSDCGFAFRKGCDRGFTHSSLLARATLVHQKSKAALICKPSVPLCHQIDIPDIHRAWPQCL